MTNNARIILISDNHRVEKAIADIRNQYCRGEILVHCGDSEMPAYMLEGYVAVQGNNDDYKAYPDRRILKVAGHSILILHGHRDMFFGQYGMLAEKAKSQECDIVMFGHTHRYFDDEIDGVRILNPGSIWHNRDGSEPSYMIVDLIDGRVLVKRMKYHV